MDMMMSEVLMRLGWTSLQSAVLVALVWGVCRLLPQLPSATRCRLWWLVAAQAVLGLLWSSPLELAVLPAPAAVTAPAMALPAFDAAVQAAPVTYAATALESATMTASWPLLLLAAWAAGVLLMLMHSLRGYRASRALVRSATECTDAGLQQALQLAAEAHGLRRSPQLKLSAQIRSPQLIGPWRPVLLLPARELPTMSADDLDMALTHELIHLQRRDLWWGLLPALSQHLFFFHPLVHVAAREYALAREEACDGAVVAGHDHCRHDYGRLLVQLGVAPRPAVGVASASPNLRSLKRRLRTLQQTRSVPRVASLAITALFVVIGIAPLRLVAAPPPPAAPQAPAPAPEPPPAPPPVSAPQPPQAPAAPRAPAPPEALADDVSFVTHGKLNITRQPAQAFVLIGGESNFVDASVADLKQARRDAGNDQPALWVRRGQDRYLIRDPAVLKALGHTQTEVAALGTAQAELGNRQAAIGQQIAAASLQITADAMASVDVSAVVNSAIRDAGLDAAVEADRAARQAARQSRAAASAASQAAREARTASARAVDARQIALVAREQAELGKEQARLAQQQSVASARAVRDVRTAIDQALASGKAERVRN